MPCIDRCTIGQQIKGYSVKEQKFVLQSSVNLLSVCVASVLNKLVLTCSLIQNKPVAIRARAKEKTRSLKIKLLLVCETLQPRPVTV